MQVYCPGKTKAKLNTVNMWEKGIGFHKPNRNPLSDCPDPLKGSHLIATGWDWAPYLIKSASASGGYTGVNFKIIDSFAQVKGFTWMQIDYQFHLNLPAAKKYRMWWGTHQVSQKRLLYCK